MNNKLNAYVRFDGSGKIVPSSVILQRTKPKVGNWKQIDSSECCNYTTTTTSTTMESTTTTTTTIPLIPQSTLFYSVCVICEGPGCISDSLELYTEQTCIDNLTVGCHMYTDLAGTINAPEGYYQGWPGVGYFYIDANGLVLNIDTCPQPK